MTTVTFRKVSLGLVPPSSAIGLSFPALLRLEVYVFNIACADTWIGGENMGNGMIEKCGGREKVRGNVSKLTKRYCAQHNINHTNYQTKNYITHVITRKGLSW